MLCSLYNVLLNGSGLGTAKGYQLLSLTLCQRLPSESVEGARCGFVSKMTFGSSLDCSVNGFLTLSFCVSLFAARLGKSPGNRPAPVPSS